MQDEVMDSLADPQTADRLREQLIQLARVRYSISHDAAEDVVQNALAAYIEVRRRYEASVNSQAILFGIFFNKCLEHIDRSVRESRRLRKYCTSADAARDNPWIRPGAPAQEPGVLTELVRREDGEQIEIAIGQLRPKSKELAQLITRRGMDRQQLISKLGINRNTLDSRLHVCRNELRRLLLREGVAM